MTVNTETPSDEITKNLISIYETKIENLTRFYNKIINENKEKEAPPLPPRGSNISVQFSDKFALYKTTPFTLKIKTIDDLVIKHNVLTQAGYNPFIIKGVTAEFHFIKSGSFWEYRGMGIFRSTRNIRHPHKFTDDAEWCLGDLIPGPAKTYQDVETTISSILDVITHIDTNALADPQIYERWLTNIVRKTNVKSIRDFTYTGKFISE